MITADTGAPSAAAASATSDRPGAVPGQWVMPAGDYSSTRFSPLDQITAANVATLRPAWTFATGVLRGHEGQPLVVGSTLYLITPYPNRVFAIDLANPGGPLKWQFNPRPQSASQGVACCDVVNRGLAYGDGRIYFNTLDNRTFALDANTGAVLWHTKLGDIDQGESITMAPLFVKGKVLVGNSGGEFGVRGWLTALDAATGKIAWRAYGTGPDSAVLIEQSYFRPFYPKDQGTNLGVKTWPGDAWTIGGATGWGWLSYDPELDLVYSGTSNPGPWNPDMRPGDNKWSSTIFARDPDDGRARWAYQVTPHDEHDYDAMNETILVDLPIDGQTRRVLVQFNKNGFAYTMDRATGEVLVAKPFGNINWAFGVDLQTGLPIVNEAKSTGTGEWTSHICPVFLGVKDIPPAAFSPRTGLFYVPTINLCMDYQGSETSYISGTPYLGAAWRSTFGPGGNGGAFIAWDAAAGRRIWEIPERFPVWSGALVTGSDLVFYGTMEGNFKAVDARTGEVLWSYRLGSGIVGNPIAYTGPDGKEYVAVLAGVGGNAAVPLLVEAAEHQPTAGAGLTGPMADLPKYTNQGGTLYVFGLP